MKRDGHENATFFIGPEVEHTPAYSKKTLFVVGKQDLNKIVELAREHKVNHIFMGANHSFDIDPKDNTFYWDKTIQELLDRGFWVTLDYPAHRHENVLLMLNNNIWTSRMFVPMLSVRIPKVQTSSSNLTIKIDDVDFAGTNPGVWCMNWHEITDSNRFTDWQEYGTDLILQSKDNKPAPVKDVPRVDTKSSSTVAGDMDTDVINPGPTGWAGSLKIPVPEKDDDVKNDGNLGLDPNSKSMLKGEAEKIVEKLNITALDAAEAYAEGAKTDPLGKSTLSLKKAKK